MRLMRLMIGTGAPSHLLFPVADSCGAADTAVDDGVGGSRDGDDSDAAPGIEVAAVDWKGPDPSRTACRGP